MELGRIGVWSRELRSEDGSVDIAAAAAELERLGYGAVWLGGSPSVHHARPLLEATSRLVVATGILSIWDGAAETVAAQRAELAAAHPGRFLLGIGASHSAMARDYSRPYSATAAFLDGLDAAPIPVPAAERVLAALGPKMLALAAARSRGAHPYLVTPEHTARAREGLGDALLAPEVKVVWETDPAKARELARGHLGIYLTLPNYTNNLLRLGFTEADFADGGSDRLVDAVFAWGSPDAVRARIEEYESAGADHVVVQVIADALPLRAWSELAGTLGLG
ncbi:LLM class F420-dependent oxidoreductase [Actinocorallia longicatena]|uniref:LLM class F420-dependent oxidoreductase n=1 Tax=Actinocorallia longicatena TaxID=111803 RepID=A0ABP6Q9F8_9ACTN